MKAELGVRQAASEGVEDEARRVLVTRPLAVTKKWTVYAVPLSNTGFCGRLTVSFPSAGFSG